MAPDRLRERIASQFSYADGRSDVWRVFDRLLDTGAFLNLGYSPRYLPHVVGSPQRRLADVVGRRLATHLPRTAGVTLLDVGCGRGGPAVHLADRFGFDVTGVDLVGYNVARARENAAARGVDAEFVVGDATRLPFEDGSMAACTAVDALVYLPERERAFAALADVLEPGGVVVLSDLLVEPGPDDADGRRVDRFADAWDMPAPGSVAAYQRGLDAAGFDVVETADLTAHSVGRFRTWTTAFLGVYDGGLEGVVDRLLTRRGLDPDAVVDQIRSAHAALPSLEHGLFVARRQG